MTGGSVQIIQGNALDLPLADNSVDLVVTSPPYFGLRSYQDGGEHYDGQIGAEATPAEFVDALIESTREMMRVVKPSGSIWVNLGDKYAQATERSRNGEGARRDPGNVSSSYLGQTVTLGSRVNGVKQKSLIGIPWRYALRCIDELGLILRAEVIWSKPNGLPESVTDRVRRSHEQWFCFEQSGGVEATAQSFPFCPLCGRPVDPRSTLVRRLQECDGSVQPGDVPDHVRADGLVESDGVGSHDGDVQVGLGGSPVPELVVPDAEPVEDGVRLVEDGGIAVVDADAEMGRPVAPMTQGDGALSVDDSGKPADVCECDGHPLIINDEAWLPQSLAAEIMQLVADGEVDPQQAADFLSGDYVRNHSVWFHFTLNPRYYSAVDEVREAHLFPNQTRTSHSAAKAMAHISDQKQTGLGGPLNPLGKLPGSVWTIPTEPLRVPDHLGVDHFAAFPTEWPRRIITGWSPRGVCVECGEGRRPVVEKTTLGRDNSYAGGARSTASPKEWLAMKAANPDRITGEACDCPEPTAPTTPGVVLDPFGGTGTTALVAHALGRHGVSNDMSADYCRLARWRTSDPKQQAKAARREYKPPAEQVPAQAGLFDMTEDIA